MTIRQRLSLAFGILALLVIASALLGLNASSRSSKAFFNYVDGPARRIELANKLLDETNSRAIAARNLVLVSDPAHLAREQRKVEAAHAAVQRHLSELKERAAQVSDPKVRSMVAAIAEVESRYGPVALDIVGKALRGERDAAIAKMAKECTPLLAELLNTANAYLAYGAEVGRVQVGAAEQASSNARTLLLAALIVAICAAAAMAIRIPRSLVRALGAEPGDLAKLAQNIADGDLRPAQAESAAVAGSVLASMAAMRANLARIVEEVRLGSDSVATASTEIAQGNQDLSARTEDQASALQQTASSMDELGSTVKQTADNARQADQLAQGARQVAAEGGKVMAQVVDTMKGINDSSRKIADIIGVIDGIAFQTNILALNAAVEAARAGEQGRGFAVVAGEVRTLAQRSAQAAREIKGLINDSVERVEQGGSLVDRAGQTMQEVVNAISRVFDIVGEISVASAEQSNGVTQVGQAVTQMDHATQQNAALVEEAAAAASSLQQQARQLVQAVAVFRNA